MRRSCEARMFSSSPSRCRPSAFGRRGGIALWPTSQKLRLPAQMRLPSICLGSMGRPTLQGSSGVGIVSMWCGWTSCLASCAVGAMENGPQRRWVRARSTCYRQRWQAHPTYCGATPTRHTATAAGCRPHQHSEICPATLRWAALALLLARLPGDGWR